MILSIRHTQWSCMLPATSWSIQSSALFCDDTGLLLRNDDCSCRQCSSTGCLLPTSPARTAFCHIHEQDDPWSWSVNTHHPERNVRLFADDCLLYNNIYQLNQTMTLLQNYLLKLEEWQNSWLIKFNPTKCFTMTLASRKPTPNLYTFCGQQLKSVQSYCYLVQISNTLNWTAQCNSVARKAQQTLGVIRRNLNKCPTHIKPTHPLSEQYLNMRQHHGIHTA